MDAVLQIGEYMVSLKTSCYFSLVHHCHASLWASRSELVINQEKLKTDFCLKFSYVKNHVHTTALPRKISQKTKQQNISLQSL